MTRIGFPVSISKCWDDSKLPLHASHVALPTYSYQFHVLYTCKIGHILRRNCLLKQVIEGKIKGQIEVTRRRGRRCNKLLDDLKDRRRYCQLKEEALDRTMWRNRFGRCFGPVVWQITDDDIYIYIYLFISPFGKPGQDHFGTRGVNPRIILKCIYRNEVYRIRPALTGSR